MRQGWAATVVSAVVNIVTSTRGYVCTRYIIAAESTFGWRVPPSPVARPKLWEPRVDHFARGFPLLQTARPLDFLA